MVLEIQILKKDENKKYYIKEAHPCTMFMKGIYLCSFRYGRDKLSLLYDAEKNNLRIGTSRGYEDYDIRQKEIRRFLKGHYYICIAEPIYVDYIPTTVGNNDKIKDIQINNTPDNNNNRFDKYNKSNGTISV